MLKKQRQYNFNQIIQNSYYGNTNTNKQKLQRALTFEIKKVNKALVNNKCNQILKITDVIFIEPKIIIPEDIDKDDFEKATEIDFERTPIRLNKAGESSIHYCNGNAN